MHLKTDIILVAEYCNGLMIHETEKLKFLQSQQVKRSLHELVELGGLLCELHHHRLVEELVGTDVIAHPLDNEKSIS